MTARAVILVAAVISLAAACTVSPTVIQPQRQPSDQPSITYTEGHVIPIRTFPPPPPVPAPTLINGQLTLTKANAVTQESAAPVMSIPVGTIVHVQLNTKHYEIPSSSNPHVLVRTSPPPPGILADFRATGPGRADLQVSEVTKCANCGLVSSVLFFPIAVRGS